jgi:hypothetical protein
MLFWTNSIMEQHYLIFGRWPSMQISTIFEIVLSWRIAASTSFL